MEKSTIRFFGGIGLGAITGIICLLGNLPQIPLGSPNASYLMVAFWQRLIMGLAIGWFPKLDKVLWTVLRGAGIGALFSLHLAFFTGVFGINFFIAGIVFGIVIDGVLFKLVK